MMLSSILFAGLANAERLPEEHQLRRLLSTDNLVPAQEPRRAAPQFYRKGSAPADGMVVFIYPVHTDSSGSEYTRLTSTGGFESCFFKAGNPSSEQLWYLEKTYSYPTNGDALAPVDTYFIQSYSHSSVRMSYYYENHSDDGGDNIYQTCGLAQTWRHQWYFQPIPEDMGGSGNDDDLIHGIVNRNFASEKACRIRAGGSSYKAKHETDDGKTMYKCHKGDDLKDLAYPQMDGIYSLWGPSLAGYIPMDSNDWTHFRLVNPFESTAGWTVLSDLDHSKSVESAEVGYTYSMGITSSFEQTKATETKFGTSLEVSVGGSVFGMDLSSTLTLDFESTYSSSYTSAMGKSFATTESLTYTLSAGHCALMTQLKTSSEDYENSSFDYFSPVRKLETWCCDTTETLCKLSEEHKTEWHTERDGVRRIEIDGVDVTDLYESSQ